MLGRSLRLSFKAKCTVQVQVRNRIGFNVKPNEDTSSKQYQNNFQCIFHFYFISSHRFGIRIGFALILKWCVYCPCCRSACVSRFLCLYTSWLCRCRWTFDSMGFSLESYRSFVRSFGLFWSGLRESHSAHIRRQAIGRFDWIFFPSSFSSSVAFSIDFMWIFWQWHSV